MQDDESATHVANRPFKPMPKWQTSRSGQAHAQAMAASETGPYLVVQQDEQNVHLETRERFKHGGGRLRNRRQSRVTLSGRDARQLASILQGRDSDQDPVLAQTLEARLAHTHAALASARQRAEAAQRQAAAAVRSGDRRIAGLRSIIDRLPKALKTPLIRLAPALESSAVQSAPPIGAHTSASDSWHKPAAVVAIEFALATDDGLTFLDCWLHGDFDAIRRQWPACPAALFESAGLGAAQEVGS